MYILFFLLVSTTIWSQTDNPVKKVATLNAIREKYAEAGPDDINTAIKLLKLDLAPFVKTLDRDITTFNYRDSDVLKFAPDEKRNKDNPKAIAYAHEWGDAAKKHLPKETGMVGWGLYTSNNPSSSESYGGYDPSLVTLKYKKGSKMLDVRKADESNIPISLKTAEYLGKLCNTSFLSWGTTIEGTDYTRVNKRALIQNPKCHQVYVKAMEGLGVTGIIYDWGAAHSKFCDGKINGAAFVSFGSEFSDATIDLYSKLPKDTQLILDEIDKEKKEKKKEKLKKELKITPKELMAYEKLAVALDGYNMYGQMRNNFRSFEPDSKQKQAYIDEWKKELFGCDKKYEEQDSAHYNADQVWEVLLKDGLMNLDFGKDLNQSIRECVGE